MLRDLAGTAADQPLTFACNPASQTVTRTSANDNHASNPACRVSRACAVNGLNQYATSGPCGTAWMATHWRTGAGETGTMPPIASMGGGGGASVTTGRFYQRTPFAFFAGRLGGGGGVGFAAPFGFRPRMKSV